MEIDELRRKINAGDYHTKLPYATAKKDRAANEAFSEDESRLVLQFQHDLAEACGVLGHEKEMRLWHLAWEHGHASGLSEVANYYSDFAELVRP